MSLKEKLSRLLDEHDVSDIIATLGECAKEKEKGLKFKYDEELASALAYALCDINRLSRPKRARGFWEWICNNSRQTHIDVYSKKFSVENAAPAIRELVKRLDNV